MLESPGMVEFRQFCMRLFVFVYLVSNEEFMVACVVVGASHCESYESLEVCETIVRLFQALETMVSRGS